MSSCESTTICVVGAGIIGLSIAWNLAAAGETDILIIEKTGIGAEASGIQPGGVRQQWSTAINCELARESVLFYENINRHLEPLAPVRLERCGYVFIADSADELRILGKSVALQNKLGIKSVVLSPDELSVVVPGIIVHGMFGAAYYDRDGYFDRPQGVVEAFAAAAGRTGTTIVPGHVVDISQHGERWKLKLFDGRAVIASQVVLAGGYELLPLAETLDLRLPVTKQPRYLFLSDPIRERLLEPLVVAPARSFAAKHLADGRVLASDLSAGVVAGADESDWRATVRSAIRATLPVLKYVSFPILAEGFYDVTPDHQPIIGEVAGRPGLWLAVGFSGHGFMLAPAIGRRVAEAVVHGLDDVIFACFSRDRFDAANSLASETQIV